MICAQNVTKKFDDIVAVDRVTADITTGSVFGLVGTNGAGKSTFLRILAGVFTPDVGQVTICDQPVFENMQIKSKVFYISDEQYFFPNSTPREVMEYYARIYPKFSRERFTEMTRRFGLDPNRRISTFSKGMKKQVSVICAVSSMADYLLCDETFDGLDPVMRQAVKAIFAAEIADRNITPVVASHNLRELEDICTHVGLLHRGGILFSRDLDDMKLGIHKIQCVFDREVTRETFPSLAILSFERRGSLYTITARGERGAVTAAVSGQNPIFFETLPLSLEEIFITETEVVGYDVKKLIF